MVKRPTAKSSSRRKPARPARRVRKPAAYSFAFQGFRDGWYVLVADMTIVGESLDALAFESRVAEWLITQRITPGKWSHFGAGNTGEYPVLPTEDGSALGLLLKRPADVLRLSAEFPCTGLTDETILAALQAEARVHRFVLDDAAKIIHTAIHQLVTTMGDEFPLWTALDGETRVAFTIQVRQRMEHADEPVERLHETWVDQRRRDGWRYGSKLDATEHTDPLMVPWKNLRPMNQARYRLIASMASAMAPLMED
jgi:hypothetical protein